MRAGRTSEKATEARHATLSVREFMHGYRTLLEDALREEGLTLPQLRLLRAVSEQQTEVSSATIARLCQITPQTLQIMLERAVREGWIVRSTPARNQRILTASLTPSGRALLKRGKAMAAQIEARLWRGVSLSTLKQFNRVLDHGIAKLHAELLPRSN